MTMTIKLHVGEASHVSATQYFDKHIGEANQAFASPTADLTEANPLVKRPELNAGPLNRTALIEQLPHHSALEQSEPPVWVALLQEIPGSKIRKMSDAEIYKYYEKHPEDHSEHPGQVSRSNGLEVIGTAADWAFTALGVASGVGAVAAIRHMPRLALRKKVGLTSSTLRGKGFEQAVTERDIKIQLMKATRARGKGNTRIAEIDTELVNLKQRLFEAPARAKAPLLKQQAALEQERKFIVEDMSQLTKNTVLAANKRYEVIGSNLRASADFVVSPLPPAVVRARVEQLLQREHPALVRAANGGDTAALQKLKELEYVVGVTPQNVAQKEMYAQAALDDAVSKAPKAFDAFTEASIQQHGAGVKSGGEAAAALNSTVDTLRTQWKNSLNDVNIKNDIEAIEAGLKMLRDYRATVEAASARTQPWIF